MCCYACCFLDTVEGLNPFLIENVQGLHKRRQAAAYEQGMRRARRAVQRPLPRALLSRRERRKWGRNGEGGRQSTSARHRIPCSFHSITCVQIVRCHAATHNARIWKESCGRWALARCPPPCSRLCHTESAHELQVQVRSAPLDLRMKPLTDSAVRGTFRIPVRVRCPECCSRGNRSAVQRLALM
jgi:hypothetical protein